MEKLQPSLLTDERKIEFLSNPRTQRYFMLFLARPRTSTDAAKELGTSSQHMAYHVKKMLELELIKRLDGNQYVSVENAYVFRYLEHGRAIKGQAVKLQILHQVDQMEQGLEYLVVKKHKSTNYLYRNGDGQAIASNRPPVHYEVPSASAAGFAKGGLIELPSDLAEEFEERIEILLQEFEQRTKLLNRNYHKLSYLYSLVMVQKKPRL